MSQRSFWGKYDIRAVVGQDFTAAHYEAIGQTYVEYLKRTLGAKAENGWVSVGNDARLHSPELTEALIRGLTQSGMNVARLGLSTSPVVYFSEHLHALNPDFPAVLGTLMVTASHNPAEYNGVKFTYQKRTLQEDEFHALRDLYHELPALNLSPAAQPGQVESYSILPDYLAWFKQHFGMIGTGIKVVVDSGNATAGIIAPEVLRALGCEVVDIFTEPDGRFPNHHPDPCVHKNLTFLMAEVTQVQADLGVAFDGDSDRLGIVDEKGRIVPGDLITLFLTEDVLKAYPGAKVVFDIKSTQTIFDYVQARQGTAILAASGHAYMKRIMKDQDIPLGGELSGHLFFRDRHWGFDDALYAACRFIEALAHHRGQSSAYRVSDFADSLPPTVASEEIRVACTREAGKQLMADLKVELEKAPDFFGVPITDILTIDGVRANFENGFFLIRGSGTEPCVTLRFEAPQAQYEQVGQRVQEICDRLQSQSTCSV